jgi:hypothetical protein
MPELSLSVKIIMSLLVLLLLGVIVVFHVLLDGSPFRSRPGGRSSPR